MKSVSNKLVISCKDAIVNTLTNSFDKNVIGAKTFLKKKKKINEDTVVKGTKNFL